MKRFATRVFSSKVNTLTALTDRNRAIEYSRIKVQKYFLYVDDPTSLCELRRTGRKITVISYLELITETGTVRHNFHDLREIMFNIYNCVHGYSLLKK